MGEDHRICDYVRRLLNYGAYESWIQSFVVQAEYWHDPLNEEEYRAKSVFLADINNENEPRNATYKENLAKLDKFVMVKFEDDSMVDPRATEWFGFYKEGQGKVIETLKESAIYKEDRIGLKAMDEAGKLVFLSTPGEHLQFTETFFIEKIVKPYLIN